MSTEHPNGPALSRAHEPTEVVDIPRDGQPGTPADGSGGRRGVWRSLRWPVYAFASPSWASTASSSPLRSTSRAEAGVDHHRVDLVERHLEAHREAVPSIKLDRTEDRT